MKGWSRVGAGQGGLGRTVRRDNGFSADRRWRKEGSISVSVQAGGLVIREQIFCLSSVNKNRKTSTYAPSTMT